MRLRLSIPALFLVSLAALGQSDKGTIAGTVTDPDGVGVSNAAVQVKNLSSGIQFQTASSASGAYSIGQLPPGAYQITVASPGLQPFIRPKVEVAAAQSVRVDARLRDFPSLGALGEDRTFYADIFSAHDAPSGPAPRTPDGKPDFSGMWHTLRTVDPGRPEMLPSADALFKERTANNLKDFPPARCLPYGATMAGSFLPFRIMQNQTLVAILYAEDLPREIYLDGRKHPDEPLAPFVGHSVGKWDGDTLVVDTVGLNGKTWLDLMGHPHTDHLHLIERYTRKDLGHLEVEVTIDDPQAYKKPWMMKRASELAAATEELGQYVCTENNLDVEHLVGK